jgi:hypothetical protein
MAYLTSLTLVPELGWSYYSTFVLEEKHGFNKTTVKTWVTDQIKTYVLTAVIGLPFLAGFLRIIQWAGKNFVPWLMLFVVSVQLTLQIIFPILSESYATLLFLVLTLPSPAPVQQIHPRSRRRGAHPRRGARCQAQVPPQAPLRH